MAIRKMFSIRDTKVGTYNAPGYKLTAGEAERDFRTIVNDPKSGPLHDYPEDFDLFEIGEFDDQTGKIKTLDTPHHIAKAADVKQTRP